MSEARDEAARLAKLPIDERTPVAKMIRDRETERVDADAVGVHVSIPIAGKLRLNVTDGESPGYVRCSLFQSPNGVNWGCSASDLVFDADWFGETFGQPFVGRRIEFSIVDVREVSD